MISRVADLSIASLEGIRGNRCFELAHSDPLVPPIAVGMWPLCLEASEGLGAGVGLNAVSLTDVRTHVRGHVAHTHSCRALNDVCRIGAP
jgi:hypothetical protein